MAFIGQIMMFGGNFAPAGWAICDGSTMAIQDNLELFNLIGTTYGGDGETTFALPDLRGRAPLGQGQGRGLSPYSMGEAVGIEAVQLAPNQMPPHGHGVNAVNGPGNVSLPIDAAVLAGLGGQAWDGATKTPGYGAGAQTPLHPVTVGSAGGSQPHDNRQPYLTVNFCIALTGPYPPQ